MDVITFPCLNIYMDLCVCEKYLYESMKVMQNSMWSQEVNVNNMTSSRIKPGFHYIRLGEYTTHASHRVGRQYREALHRHRCTKGGKIKRKRKAGGSQR